MRRSRQSEASGSLLKTLLNSMEQQTFDLSSLHQSPPTSPRLRSSKPWISAPRYKHTNHGAHYINQPPLNHQMNASRDTFKPTDMINGTLLEERLECTEEVSSKVQVESLRREVEELKTELNITKATVVRLVEREKKLRDRLSEQAQRQLEKGATKFEDICLGENRPTQLIKRYGNLYSESRLEAMDALDDLEEMSDCDDLKVKLLLSVVVLAFRTAQRKLQDVKSSIRNILNIPIALDNTTTPHRQAARELEDSISIYLRKTVDKYDVSICQEEVSERVWATLYDYPCLRKCPALFTYISDCVRLAWALSIQKPSLVIDYESKTFHPDHHVRFHSSDSECDVIKAVLWPMLTEGEGGACVYKGVVIT